MSGDAGGISARSTGELCTLMLLDGGDAEPTGGTPAETARDDARLGLCR